MDSTSRSWFGTTVSRVIAQEPDSAAVGRQIAEAVRGLFESRAAILYRLDPATQDLIGAAGAGAVGAQFGNQVFPRGPEVRALASEGLAARGYRVLLAATGAEALALGERYPGMIDLMVTDVVMPGMSGPELVRRMRPAHPGMRVLFISGYTDDAIGRHGLLDAGIAYLPKPFTPSVLARKVREVLETSPAR